MFKIYDGREHFYQWDLDRKLIVGDRTIQAVHFCNRTGACAITRDCYDVNGMWLVDVPNLCLQESYRLKVYGFSAAKYTTVSAQFDVKSRTKPDGYVYTDDEVACWQALDQRVAALEENPVSDEAIAAGIDKYLIENPIEVGATDAEKEQIARNAEDIAALKSLSNTYATEEYVDVAVANAGGGESEIEFVEATGDENIEFDKTFDEIMAMIRAGKIVVIKYYGQLYYHCGGHTFRYVGSAETRYITLKDADNTFYGETILTTMEEVEDTVNAAIANIEVGGGESEIEFVNASGEDTIELDKTYDEIMAMVDAGKVVVIKHDGYLYYQTSRSKFTYVGPAETRSITFSKYGDTINYSETTLPTMEEVEDTISAAMPDYLTGYATEEYVNNAVANAGGSADCSVMVIKSNNSTDSIQLDKTFNEIKTATDGGKTVVILHNNKYYSLTKKALSLFTFSLTEKTKIEKILVYQGMVKTSEDNFITTNDIANFQTAEQVEEAINAAIPDVSAYQTAEQVNAAIVAYVGVIENGTY